VAVELELQLVTANVEVLKAETLHLLVQVLLLQPLVVEVELPTTTVEITQRVV
jgi:hypothetical protein